jgi:hypothetical protein
MERLPSGRAAQTEECRSDERIRFSLNREGAKNAKNGPASSKVSLRRLTAMTGRWLHLAAGGSPFVSFYEPRQQDSLQVHSTIFPGSLRAG